MSDEQPQLSSLDTVITLQNFKIACQWKAVLREPNVNSRNKFGLVLQPKEAQGRTSFLGQNCQSASANSPTGLPLSAIKHFNLELSNNVTLFN